jgi:NTP pyrophosphatase (non-canonical NTP hydrolase)
VTPSIFQRAIDAWGIPAQIAQTIEECCELGVALSHAQRNDRVDMSNENTRAVLTEMADVAIMLEQMKIVYGADNFQAEYERKLARLEDKLNQECPNGGE